MSAKEYLIDSASRRQVFVQRYAGGESKKALTILNRLKREVVGRLMEEPTDFQRSRMAALLADIDSIINGLTKEIGESVLKSSQDILAPEAEFTKKMVDKAVKTNISIPDEQALSFAFSQLPMNAPEGAVTITIEQALRQFTNKKREQISQIVMDGIALGDTTQDVARKVGDVADNLLKRQVDALTRTMINHAANVARNEVYGDNEDVIDGYEWVSTLDSKTTLICASRDGKVYQRGQGPLPPAHWGCRSTIVPNVNQAFTLAKLKGRRPEKGDKTGTVSGTTTYGGWLKKQSKEFQDEALGVERAKLFRAGELTIDEFTDPTGRTYTLDELRGRLSLSIA